MENIYEKHDAKFKGVSAYIIMKDNHMIGGVTIKHGKARLEAFTHISSCEMTYASCGGGNYDKASDAVTNGFAKTKKLNMDDDKRFKEYHEKINGYVDDITKALEKRGGNRWSDALHHAGFTVLQAI